MVDYSFTNCTIVTVFFVLCFLHIFLMLKTTVEGVFGIIPKFGDLV